MKELEILLLMAIVAMSILLIILLQKITILKKQTDEIIKEIKGYLDCVLMEPEESENKRPSKKENEELQNRIIQAVLGEYFP